MPGLPAHYIEQGCVHIWCSGAVFIMELCVHIWSCVINRCDTADITMTRIELWAVSIYGVVSYLVYTGGASAFYWSKAVVPNVFIIKEKRTHNEMITIVTNWPRDPHLKIYYATLSPP